MKDELYMQRCLELARCGAGNVAPNPMVGAVLVHQNRIIGEGWHRQFGGPHAEVNCLASVMEKDISLISGSTLYVSLEPCNHFGKTPPCTDLIIEKKIQKVIIGCLDPAAEVNGKGIQRLKDAGIEVEYGVLEKECKEQNKRFYVFHQQHRPYVILKWAQTKDGYVAPSPSNEGIKSPQPVNRVFISNEKTNRLVHKWRSEEMAILVGTNTAWMDNPELTTRLWPGNSPIRLVVDLDLRLPETRKLFDGTVTTLVFNTRKHTLDDLRAISSSLGGVWFYQVTADVSLVQQVLHALYRMHILSVMVEGGARLLQSFLDEGLWDEARIITNTKMTLQRGLPAPVPENYIQSGEEKIMDDLIRYVRNKRS
jgi:diaminohydroxyphosphoribosylaminopyrimidine deaminase/5-amino-6-(5-phosphoribosylamino)uracil reductase